MHVQRASEHRAMPWANGRGTTEEIATWPSSDRWDWRLSLAMVERDGPFSAFARTDRVLMVVQGRGLTLRFPDQRDGEATPEAAHEAAHDVHGTEVELTRFESASFDGEAITICALSDGPVRVLNLLVRRDALFETAHLRLVRVAKGDSIDVDLDVEMDVVMDETDVEGGSGTALETHAGLVLGLVVLDGAFTVSTPTVDFPGNPRLDRVGKFDAILPSSLAVESHNAAGPPRALAPSSYAHLRATARAAVDSVIAVASLRR